MTILEVAHHSLIIVEHDPLLYEDAQEKAEYVSQAQKGTAKDATPIGIVTSSFNEPGDPKTMRNAESLLILDENR